MRLNSPQINLILKACMKASKSLIRDFGEIEKLQVSTKGPGILLHQQIKELKKLLLMNYKKLTLNMEF